MPAVEKSFKQLTTPSNPGDEAAVKQAQTAESLIRSALGEAMISMQVAYAHVGAQKLPAGDEGDSQRGRAGRRGGRS